MLGHKTSLIKMPRTEVIQWCDWSGFTKQYGIKFKTVTSAIGTASPSVLDYFGLTETHKDVFLAVIPSYLEEKCRL